MMRFLRSAYVIARRDFSATVLSKAFIFFLLGPPFPLLLGGVFGGIGARVATQTSRPVIAVVSSPSDFQRLAKARDQLAQAISQEAVVTFVYYPPERDLAAQQRQLLASGDPPVRAVLTGGLDNPHLAGAIAGDPSTLGQLRLLIGNARTPEKEAPALIRVTSVDAGTSA